MRAYVSSGPEHGCEFKTYWAYQIKRRVAQQDQSAALRQAKSRVLITARRPMTSLPEGSAEWSATGPENQGDREVRGSIPQPSSNPGIRTQGSGIGIFCLIPDS